jgi:hypothetical protein
MRIASAIFGSKKGHVQMTNILGVFAKKTPVSNQNPTVGQTLTDEALTAVVGGCDQGQGQSGRHHHHHHHHGGNGGNGGCGNGGNGIFWNNGGRDNGGRDNGGRDNGGRGNGCGCSN